jgi:hypothetical protein
VRRALTNICRQSHLGLQQARNESKGGPQGQAESTEALAQLQKCVALGHSATSCGTMQQRIADFRREFFANTLMSKSPNTTHPNSIGFNIYCFAQISVTIERKLPNLVPLDAKNSAQVTIHRKIDFVGSVYGLSCDGIVKISTTGMGAQSRLHG